jgi:hypothetical protein
MVRSRITTAAALALALLALSAGIALKGSSQEGLSIEAGGVRMTLAVHKGEGVVMRFAPVRRAEPLRWKTITQAQHQGDVSTVSGA